MRSSRSSLLVGAALVAFSACSSFKGSDTSSDAGSTCQHTPFTPAAIDQGAVCGVGDCRVVLTGACPKAVPPGGTTETLCGAAFPAEVCGNGKDDDCDGVVDNGCAGEAGNAGFACAGCAVGQNVKLQGDGTATGQLGDYRDNSMHVECINSDLCSLPGPAWVHNIAGKGVTCAQFCQGLGATCKPLCATVAGQCDSTATSVNQGNKTFGTFSADYHCLEVTPSGSNAVPTGKTNTGDCAFVPRDTGLGPISDNRFNVECCCAF
jgi:hypothetical protein